MPSSPISIDSGSDEVEIVSAPLSLPRRAKLARKEGVQGARTTGAPSTARERQRAPGPSISKPRPRHKRQASSVVVSLDFDEDGAQAENEQAASAAPQNGSRSPERLARLLTPPDDTSRQPEASTRTAPQPSAQQQQAGEQPLEPAKLATASGMLSRTVNERSRDKKARKKKKHRRPPGRRETTPFVPSDLSDNDEPARVPSSPPGTRRQSEMPSARVIDSAPESEADESDGPRACGHAHRGNGGSSSAKQDASGGIDVGSGPDDDDDDGDDDEEVEEPGPSSSRLRRGKAAASSASESRRAVRNGKARAAPLELDFDDEEEEDHDDEESAGGSDDSLPDLELRKPTTSKGSSTRRPATRSSQRSALTTRSKRTASPEEDTPEPASKKTRRETRSFGGRKVSDRKGKAKAGSSSKSAAQKKRMQAKESPRKKRSDDDDDDDDDMADFVVADDSSSSDDAAVTDSDDELATTKSAKLKSRGKAGLPRSKQRQTSSEDSSDSDLTPPPRSRKEEARRRPLETSSPRRSQAVPVSSRRFFGDRSRRSDDDASDIEDDFIVYGKSDSVNDEDEPSSSRSKRARRSTRTSKRDRRAREKASDHSDSDKPRLKRLRRKKDEVATKRDKRRLSLERELEDLGVDEPWRRRGESVLQSSEEPDAEDEDENEDDDDANLDDFIEEDEDADDSDQEDPEVKAQRAKTFIEGLSIDDALKMWFGVIIEDEFMAKSRSHQKIYYDLLDKIEDYIKTIGDVLVGSSVWQQGFIDALRVAPKKMVRDSSGKPVDAYQNKPSPDFPWQSPISSDDRNAVDCEVCPRPHMLSSPSTMQLWGYPYMPRTFERSCDDDEQEETINKTYILGGQCRNRAQLYHSLYHYAAWAYWEVVWKVRKNRSLYRAQYDKKEDAVQAMIDAWRSQVDDTFDGLVRAFWAVYEEAKRRYAK